MTTFTLPAQTRSLFGRVTDWLDGHGRAAWIVSMILGFAIFWPVGLFLAVYITVTKRWSKNPMFGMNFCKSKSDRARRGFSAMRPSGNAAFDAYKEETLRRLVDEQEAFEAFLQRLREAKDKQEFDAFMEDRAKVHTATELELTDASGK